MCCCLASASYRRRTVPRPKCVRNKSKSTTEDRVGRREEVGVGWNGVGWSGGGQEEKRREERPTASDNWRRLAVDGTERYSLPPPSLLLLYHPLTLLYSTPCDDRPSDRPTDYVMHTSPHPSPCVPPSFVRTNGSIVTGTRTHTRRERTKATTPALHPTTHPPTLSPHFVSPYTTHTVIPLPFYPPPPSPPGRYKRPTALHRTVLYCTHTQCTMPITQSAKV